MGSIGRFLLNAKTGAEIHEFHSGVNDFGSNYITSAAFSPNGKYILTGTWSGMLILWDAQSGAQVKTRHTSFSSHTETVMSVAFSSDGKHVLTGSADGTAILWNIPVGFDLPGSFPKKSGSHPLFPGKPRTPKNPRSMRKFDLRSFRVELWHALIRREGGTPYDLVSRCPGRQAGPRFTHHSPVSRQS